MVESQYQYRLMGGFGEESLLDIVLNSLKQIVRKLVVMIVYATIVMKPVIMELYVNFV